MTARKAHLTGSTAVLCLTLAAAGGCDLAGKPAAEPGKPTAGQSPKVSVATPRDALLKAVPDTKEGAYRFDIKGGSTPMSGVLDATKKTVEIKVAEKEPSIGLTMTMTALIIDKKGWMK